VPVPYYTQLKHARTHTHTHTHTHANGNKQDGHFFEIGFPLQLRPLALVLLFPNPIGRLRTTDKQTWLPADINRQMAHQSSQQAPSTNRLPGHDRHWSIKDGGSAIRREAQVFLANKRSEKLGIYSCRHLRVLNWNEKWGFGYKLEDCKHVFSVELFVSCKHVLIVMSFAVCKH